MAFPTTSVIDDFNRADSSTSLGSNWTSPIESGFSSLGILSNQCYPAAGFRDNYWNSGFGADQEAYVTVAALPDNTTQARLYARLNTVGGAFTGYAVFIEQDGNTYLERMDAGSGTYISGGTEQIISAGDSVGIECIGDQISHWHKPAAGSWTLIKTATDATYTGSGYIGLQARDTTAPRFDNFGGGNYAGPSPRSQYLDFDYSRS